MLTPSHKGTPRAERAAAEAAERAPRGRKLEQIVASETLQAMRELRESTAELAAKLGGVLVNQVLDVRTMTFPTEGVLTLDYHVTTGSVFLENLGIGDVTLVGGPASDRAPGDGVGSAVVPAGAFQVVNIANRYLTFYGTAGSRISVQVFAKPQPPTAGVSSNTTAMRPGTVLDAAGGAAAGAAGSATLAAAAGRTTYITGFELTWLSDGTGTVNDLLTVTGPSSTFNYRVSTVAGAAGSLIVPYNSPIPASAVNTAIVVGLAGVAGRATASIVAHGFRL
jgi:hypothetical protein